MQGRWEIMRNHRSSSGLDYRLLMAMRVFNGEYEAAQLAEIRKFGGSEVYARIVGTKARGATALLRDVYFNNERPWSPEVTPNPKLPDDIVGSIQGLVVRSRRPWPRLAQPVDQGMIQARDAADLGCHRGCAQPGGGGGGEGRAGPRRHPDRG